jgi:DNA/RNA-binding domain of Phe-tRNA-synthetase-like protein
MPISIAPEIRDLFKDIVVKERVVEGLSISDRSLPLEEFKMATIESVRGKFAVDDIKDHEMIRAYRDFYWSIGIDPTKTRPAQEALLRRILQGKELPIINTAVDTYNLVSLSTLIPFAAFDADKISGDLLLRQAQEEEEFQGIGMDEPKELEGNEIIMTDSVRSVAIFPYRDADHSKVTPQTKRIHLVACGAPGIEEATIDEAMDHCCKALKKFCKA